MRKHILLALAFIVITCFSYGTAPAQLPGGLKIPKVRKPKPSPTPAATAPPAPPNETRPAVRAKKSFFFLNHDWALPVGYVFYSPADNLLYTAFWVRGDTYNISRT